MAKDEVRLAIPRGPGAWPRGADANFSVILSRRTPEAGSICVCLCACVCDTKHPGEESSDQTEATKRFSLTRTSGPGAPKPSIPKATKALPDAFADSAHRRLSPSLTPSSVREPGLLSGSRKCPENAQPSTSLRLWVDETDIISNGGRVSAEPQLPAASQRETRSIAPRLTAGRRD